MLLALALAPALGRRRSSSIHRLTVPYLQHLRTYVYDLKREAESRARALVTANTLFVAAVGFIVKTATEAHTGHTLVHVVALMTVVLGLLGALIAVTSLIQAITVFVPYVVDEASPMEPLAIRALAIDELTSHYASYTPVTIVSALCREIRAISAVQVRRSAAVRRSAITFATALVCLAGSAFTLMAVFLAQP